jgi:predicted phosphohydrolase
MRIGFDVISDLNLDAEDEFNWEGKPTSLYLIIAGNISNNLRVIHQTLLHLSRLYQGVFYIGGSLEYDSMHFIRNRHEELAKLCKTMSNVAYLHKHVVIINGVAILGCNGWYGNTINISTDLEKLHLHAHHLDDNQYLSASLEKLQLHLDVRKIIIVTHSAPGIELFFGEEPSNMSEYIALKDALLNDTEMKVTHWIYGSYHKNVDTVIDNINYINNSSFSKEPYWPKRIDIEI